MKWFLFPIFLFMSMGVSAQDPRIDSMRTSLDTANGLAVKVSLMAQLAHTYAFYQPDSSLLYARKALELSQAGKYLYGQFLAYEGFYFAHIRVGEYNESMKAEVRALKIAEQLSDNKIEALARTYMFLGFCHMLMANYEAAIAEHQKSLGLIQSSNKSILLISNSFLGVVRSYLKIGKQDSALWTFNSFVDLATSELRLPKNDSVLWKILEASPASDKETPAQIFMSIGELHYDMHDYRIAESYYRDGLKSYAIYRPLDNSYFLMRIYINLANLFMKIGESDSAIHYASLAYQTSNGKKFQDYLRTSSGILSQVYETQRKPDSAVKYLKAFQAANDSIFSPARVRQFQSIEFSEEQRQIEIEATKERFRNQIRFYSLLAALTVFLIIAFILYRNNKQKQRANAQLQSQKVEIENALSTLKTTQKQLIQAEKMASLGELTAGIAHEIQNPLNFVNNFSEVNTELFDEMEKEFREGKTSDAFDIARDIRQNLEKISQHGKRADAIVKGMLMHSRINTGQKELTDLNTLADEYLRISYHGMRAKDKSFNCEIKTSFDQTVGKLSLVPQDIGRVLMNLYNNAFYSLNEKKKRMDGEYNPLVEMHTKKNGDHVEIRIRDNGMGIPREIIDKIFQPFYTTKPAGQGTGLGLSLSYDIITKEHGGKISLETVEGEYAEFIIELSAFAKPQSPEQ